MKLALEKAFVHSPLSQSRLSCFTEFVKVKASPHLPVSEAFFSYAGNIRKGHPLPGGHSFAFLNTSINKKPFYVPQVVTYQTDYL